MAEHMTVELEQLKVKEETVSIQEEILPSSTVEDTCTVYKQEEDAQMEYKKIKSKHLKPNFDLGNSHFLVSKQSLLIYHMVFILTLLFFYFLGI